MKGEASQAMITLTVDVEEGFHGLWPSARRTMVRYKHELPEGTFIRPLRSILKLFEEEHVRSTFFVLGKIAEAFPEVVEEIHDLGHEVASHGYSHVDLTKISLTELEEMERKNYDRLTKITGEVPRGFRAPFFGINPSIISLLSKIGYVYDSSVVPSLGIPGWWSYHSASLRAHCVSVGEGEFFEVPISVFPYLRLPIGGWFLRNFGVTYVKTAIKWFLSRGIPTIIYVHPFDVDLNAQKLGGTHFYATRRCGKYTLKAMKNLLETFDCPKVPIRDMLEKIMV
jgi:hypothetical protein